MRQAAYPFLCLFVLEHPYFDKQNVLVADDGSARLRGLIDWDSMASETRCLGRPLAYPSQPRRAVLPKEARALSKTLPTGLL